MIQWTKERVLEEIIKEYEKGTDLRTGKAVRNSARNIYQANLHNNFFPSWKAAVAAAGIDLDEIKRNIKEKAWEEKKQVLIKDIQEAHKKGVKLNARSLQEGSDNRGLYDRARYYYKGKFFWESALKDAGINPDEILLNKNWNKARVKAAILKRKAEGRPLHLNAVRKDKDGGLIKAAMIHCGSWDAALKYAGFSPKKIKKTNKPIPDSELVQKIISYYLKGEDLCPAAIKKSKKKRLQRLSWVVYHRFGSWREALAVAGIDYNQFLKRKRNYWSEEKVIEKILELRDSGADLSSAVMIQEHNDVYKAGINHLGSWEKALIAAGLDYEEIRKTSIPLSKEQIITRIKAAHAAGIELNAVSIAKNKDKAIRAIYHKAIRKFKSWENAIKAAGLDYDDIKQRPSYTLEELADAVRALHERGISLRAGDVQQDPEGRKYLHAIYNRDYSSWYDFLDEIGIDTKQYREYKAIEIEQIKKELLEQILNFSKTGIDLSAVGILENDNKELELLFYKANKRFGNWENAVTAAGLDYAEIRRTRGEYTLDELAAAVLEFQEQGISLNASDMQKNSKTSNILQAACRRFDSWYDFLEEIGIDPGPYQAHKHWTKEKVIKELKEQFDSGLVTGLTKTKGLYFACSRHFGSAEEAARQAGLVYTRSGNLNKKFLDNNPEALGILFKHNQKYLSNIAKRVYYGARKFGRRTLPASELEQEAFMIFYARLCKLPKGAGIRGFCYKSIYYGLINLNKAHFKETYTEDIELIDSLKITDHRVNRNHTKI